MNRIYEEMFIVRPDATEEEITPIIDQLKSTVTSAGGTVDKEERWGVRKLAYRVEKRNEGYYVLMQFTAGPQTVKGVASKTEPAILMAECNLADARRRRTLNDFNQEGTSGPRSPIYQTSWTTDQ